MMTESPLIRYNAIICWILRGMCHSSVNFGINDREYAILAIDLFEFMQIKSMIINLIKSSVITTEKNMSEIIIN
jgi:hypothetical protein